MRPKSLKRRRMDCISFFAAFKHSSPMRGNVMWTTRGAHSLESQGMWGLGRQARCQTGTEQPSCSLPTSCGEVEKNKRKSLLELTQLSDQIFVHFVSNFVSLRKSLEQPQCFKAEAANLPISQKRFLYLISCFD